MKEYLDRVFSGISTNTELENLQPGIGNHRDKKNLLYLHQDII